MTATTQEEEQRYAELQLQALDLARAGDAEALGPYLDAGMPVNLADARGNSMLMLAAYHGQAETVRLLLAHGADVERRNDRGQTPLGGVAFKGDLAVARLLIGAGAQVDADQGGGRTPLMFAAVFGRREMVEYLAAAGSRSRSVLGIPVRRLARITAGLRNLLRRFSGAR